MKQAYGFNTQADNLLAESKAVKVAGTNQAIGSILTSGAKAYGIMNPVGGAGKFSGSLGNNYSGWQLDAAGGRGE
jgi:hypothetical protein